MKNILKLFKITLLLLTCITVLSCGDDKSDSIYIDEPKNILEIAVNEPDLSNLVTALGLADGNLVSLLSGGEYTLLAPNNFAFDLFLTTNGFASLEDVPSDLLSKILLNHVISGTVNSTALTSAGSGYATTNATNMDGDNLSLYFNTSSGVQFNGVSNVIKADLLALNGIVHVVNEVIGLPTVVTFTTADPNFSTLLSALTRDDLTTDFVSILSIDSNTDPAPFTVFAPINEAFNRLLTELDITSLSDIDEPTLDAVLKYHVVVGANVLDSELTDNLTITTLGGDITANISGGATLTDSSGRISEIITTNIQANNGVIHAINKVILP